MTALVADTPFQDVAYGTGCLYVGAGIYQGLAVRLADCIGEGEGRGVWMAAVFAQHECEVAEMSRPYYVAVTARLAAMFEYAVVYRPRTV